MRLLTLLLLLTSCLSDAQIDKKKAFLLLQSASEPEIPWYLAGGDIPESTTYTIYQPALAADLASARQNVVNPGTRDLIDGVAPTFGSETYYNYLRFNGTTQFGNTQTNYLSTHTIVILWDNGAGVYSAGSSKLLIRPINSPNTRLTLTTNTDLTGASTNSILGIRAAQGVYRNGKKLANMGAFPAGTEYPVFIGARNNLGSAANFASGNLLLYAHYDFVLSDAQLEALYESMRKVIDYDEVAYRDEVLALNPIAYYTMNQKIGKFFHDETGNKAAAEALINTGPPSGITIGHAGATGKGLAARGANNAASYIATQDTDWPTVTGIDLNNFTFCAWVNNNNSNAQARPFNTYSNTGTEYFAPEIRSGNLAVYSRENGVTWNTSPAISFPNNTWTHLCACNDNANDLIIVYVNGTKYEYNKTSTGFVDTTPDTYYPYILQSMDGYMQHAFFLNGIITQEQVNGLID